MKKTAFFIAFILNCSLVFSQYTIQQTNAIPLNGEWLFALDPLDAGEANGWFQGEKAGNGWDKVTVPHCFSVDPRFQNYTGKVWYRRTFSWQPNVSKRVILHFDAAFYQTTVFLNDKKIGTHKGGYTPFSFDITEGGKAGQNTLTVLVDNNTWRLETIPGAKDNGQRNAAFTGWLNFGGLIRPVYLTVEPLIYLDNIKVEAEPDLVKKTATVRVKVRIKNTTNQAISPKLMLNLQQNEKPISTQWKTSNTKIEAGKTGVLEAETNLKSADVTLWSLDNPALYQVISTVGNDTVRTQFGIRKVEVRNAQLLLNGQPMKLAGANRVIDYPNYGSMEPDWLIEKDMRLMKEAGMEFHRLTHYTPSESVYEWADRNGMLIITEVGNWQLTPNQMANDTMRRKFRQQFKEMAERDWNHPSVIAYSVGNEYQSSTPEGQAWTKDMIAYARELDPTRLYTFATLTLNRLPTKPEDEASQYCDFVSTNTYGMPPKVLDKIHELYPEKPILISEYGQRADHPSGEKGQIDYLTAYLQEVRKRPYVVGMSWWSFNDYQSRYNGTNVNGLRPWGIVNYDRSPRPIYAFHQQEMSPVTIKKMRFTEGAEGVHQLRIKISVRNDFPSYAISRYKLKVGDAFFSIPELAVGQSIDMDIPIRGFEKTIVLDIVKPTGFTIYHQTISLTQD